MKRFNSSIYTTAAGLVMWSQLAGCLYLKNGSTQQVDFQSEPPGAQVSVNGKQLGPTPTSATLSRCQTYEVTVEKAGYQPNRITISRNLQGGDYLLFFVDSLLIIPGIVDGYNCVTSLNPNPVVAQMTPASITPAAAVSDSPQAKEPVAPAAGK